MAYTTEATVQGEFAGVDFSASGAKVTTADVTRWIQDADEEIDSMLGGVYQVPITGTKALKVMQTIATLLVAHRVKRKLEVESPVEETSGARYQSMRKEAMEMLKEIRDQDRTLEDATKATTHDGAAGFAAKNAATVAHTFKKSTDQW